MELEWTERAIFEYEILTEYLFSTWSEVIALRVLSEIDFKIDRIRKYPKQFPVVIEQKEIRRCVASPQTSLFFAIKPQSIILLSIFDNRLNHKKYPG